MKRPRAWVSVGALFGFVFTVSMVSILSSVIWPGQAELLRPIFCDDARPDAFVVSDTYSSGTGETSTNFTLYCVGPRGDHRDVGWLWPFVGICLMNAAALALLIGAGTLWSRRRRARAARTAHTIHVNVGQPRPAPPPYVVRPGSSADVVPSDAPPTDAP
jgi:hypothetical protein